MDGETNLLFQVDKKNIISVRNDGWRYVISPKGIAQNDATANDASQNCYTQKWPLEAALVRIKLG